MIDFSSCRSRTLVVAFALLAGAGCAQRFYPVHGKVVWDNGANAVELDGGLVVGESVETGMGVRGDIQKDGSFELSTLKPGDGVPPGKYRVAVVEYKPGEPPPPPIIDRTFSNVETSGLEMNVERRNTELTLKVRKAPPRPRR